jgi:hypothetical protein
MHMPSVHLLRANGFIVLKTTISGDEVRVTAMRGAHTEVFVLDRRTVEAMPRRRERGRYEVPAVSVPRPAASKVRGALG